MSDHIPTLADVCSAIAEGYIAADVEGSMYQVNAFELRRYLNKLCPLPNISSTISSIAQSPLPCSDSSEWAASAHTSVA